MHCRAKYLLLICTYTSKNAFFLITHDSNLIQFFFQLIQNRLEEGTHPLAISGGTVLSKVMQTCTIIMLKLWEFNCNNFTNYQWTSGQDIKVRTHFFSHTAHSLFFCYTGLPTTDLPNWTTEHRCLTPIPFKRLSELSAF